MGTCVSRRVVKLDVFVYQVTLNCCIQCIGVFPSRANVTKKWHKMCNGIRCVIIIFFN